MKKEYEAAYYETKMATNMIVRLTRELEKYGQLDDELKAEVKQTLMELRNAEQRYHDWILKDIMETQNILHNYQK